MANRVFFSLVTLFWVVMNILLWRAEFGGGREFGSAVSPDVVWNKILTAPDDSRLEISLNGRRIGYCHWSANAGEELTAGKVLREELPEGMVRQLGRYTIDLEGNIVPGQPTTRVRFNLHLDFATDHTWRELSVRIATRPTVWTLHSAAAAETLDLKYEDEVGKWSRTIGFGDLRDPRKLVEEFAGPLPLALPLLGTLSALDQPRKLSLGLNWEARNDWLKIGHSQVRAYRLEARLLDRYRVVVVVSRVGEILRVELPEGLLLINDALTGL
jgi:hypothetical protein